MTERFLSMTEAAKLLGLTRDALYKRGDLPAPDAVIGTVRGWREVTLLAWDATYRPTGYEQGT